MGPVRIGNQACEQIQHDVYGSAILAVAHVFFDQAPRTPGRRRPLQTTGTVWAKWPLPFMISRIPDHGKHGTFCAFIPFPVSCAGRPATAWPESPSISVLQIAPFIGGIRPIKSMPRSAGEHGVKKNRLLPPSFDGESLDASLLLLHDLGFLSADDPRFAKTVAAIERELRHGNYIYRYVETDDFGVPENAFVVCTFWYIYASGCH